jgi:hypothetical protein
VRGFTENPRGFSPGVENSKRSTRSPEVSPRAVVSFLLSFFNDHDCHLRNRLINFPSESSARSNSRSLSNLKSGPGDRIDAPFRPRLDSTSILFHLTQPPPRCLKYLSVIVGSISVVFLSPRKNDRVGRIIFGVTGLEPAQKNRESPCWPESQSVPPPSCHALSSMEEFFS